MHFAGEVIAVAVFTQAARLMHLRHWGPAVLSKAPSWPCAASPSATHGEKAALIPFRHRSWIV